MVLYLCLCLKSNIIFIFGTLIPNIIFCFIFLGYEGSRIKCCGVDKNQFHPDCYPIRVPSNDPVFVRRNQNCMEYVRSCTAPRIGCTLGPREQINQVTALLDASGVYGSSMQEAEKLRSFMGGELRTVRSAAGRELLPPDTEQTYCKSSGKSRCFLAGKKILDAYILLSRIPMAW